MNDAKDSMNQNADVVGFWLPILARVVAKVTGVTDYNIVQNNGELCSFSIALSSLWSRAIRALISVTRYESCSGSASCTFSYHTTAGHDAGDQESQLDYVREGPER